MQHLQHQLQVFVSLVVILGAAIVALICDFLKRNNDELRELNLELQVRRDEEQKRSAASLAEKPLPAAATALASPKPAKEKKRAVNSEAMAAMERGAALAGSGGRPRVTAAAEVLVEVREAEPEQVPVPEIVVDVTAPQESKPAPVLTVKKDWGSMLTRNAQSPKPSVSITINEEVLAALAGSPKPAPAKAPEPSFESLPAGFQDGFVLHNLVERRQPVTGLVVSIGVHAARQQDGTFPESVGKLVQSLIGPDDFAAQSGEEEFLLIYPREQGASAQRRLSQISQQLWDFQLRSLGTFQILFSWGGVEVQSESIEEAIASASERMNETKRGRKLLTMASPATVAPAAEPLRQAV